MMTSSFLPDRQTIGLSLQASKWQQCPVLLDSDEMEALVEDLGEFWMVQTGGLIPTGQEMIEKETFLTLYGDYVNDLKKGLLPLKDTYRACFSTIWTRTLNALYRVKVRPEQCIIRVELPVVQLQSHRFDYSCSDKKFRSMVMGYESVEWGIQFSFPSLFQDANFQVYSVKESHQFPNASFFKQIQRWVRLHTIATPFEVDGKVVNVPIRLGKHCLNWINNHPQFPIKGLKVFQKSSHH